MERTAPTKKKYCALPGARPSDAPRRVAGIVFPPTPATRSTLAGPLPDDTQRSIAAAPQLIPRGSARTRLQGGISGSFRETWFDCDPADRSAQLPAGSLAAAGSGLWLDHGPIANGHDGRGRNSFIAACGEPDLGIL